MRGIVTTDLHYNTSHLLQLSPWCVNVPQSNMLLTGSTTHYMQS